MHGLTCHRRGAPAKAHKVQVYLKEMLTTGPSEQGAGGPGGALLPGDVPGEKQVGPDSYSWAETVHSTAY